MKFFKYLSLFLLVPLLSFTMHKYYISLCEIEYVENEASIQIILSLFIDDIELTLNKDHNTLLNLATENEVENIDLLYYDYLKRNFKVIVNQDIKVYNFVGKIYDDDIVRFYLEIPSVQSLETLEVFNTNLIRDFEDQKNIIKIKINDFNKTFYLDKNTFNCVLKI